MLRTGFTEHINIFGNAAVYRQPGRYNYRLQLKNKGTDVIAAGWLLSTEPCKSMENLTLGNCGLRYSRYLKRYLKKKYILRDSSVLFNYEVHSLVLMSTQEIYSKTLHMGGQTLPTAYDLIHQVLFIGEIKSLLTCQCPRVKSHKRVNADPLYSERCIHRVPCS